MTAMCPSTLHVVTVISNPVRYASRWQLYERFAEQMLAAGVQLTTVELTYDTRHSECAPILDRVCARAGQAERPVADGRSRLIRLQTRSELWHKENLINIGIASLPSDWRYVAWIDADVEFQRPDWASETIERLQQRDVLQLFSHAVDLDPERQLVQPCRQATSFLAAWETGARSPNGRYDDLGWHPGYAWAIRRDAYGALGGLLEVGVLGAGDRHMAMALVGMGERSMHNGVSESYKRHVLAWQERASAHVQGNVGHVPGLITHGWHGRKRQRGYHDRWQILVRNGFDPVTDIRRDPTRGGLIEWSHMATPRMRRMRDEVRLYFRSRNEDSIDLD